MGRIRTIKPEFFQDEELSALGCETHLLAAGLLCYADDYGYFNANPGLVRASVFPIRELSREIREMISDLETIGYIRLGTTPDGKRYGHVVKFSTHQRVAHPTASKIIGLPIVWGDSEILTKNSGEQPSLSALNREQGTGNREQGTEGASDAKAPTLSESTPNPDVGDVSTMVARIVVSHPRSLIRKQRWGEATYSQSTAVLKAMQDEIDASGCSGAQALEMILARVELQAREVPEGRYQFFKDIERYFALHEYRLDPEHFNREERNASNQGNRAGGVQGLGNRKADEASNALALAQARIIAQYADAEADCGVGEDVPEPRGGDGRGAAGIVLEGAR